MNPPKTIHYEIVLHIPGEARLSPYKSDNFGAVVEYCLDYAKRHPGVRVTAAISVPQNNLWSHSYPVFDVQFPQLEEFMRQNIQGYYGQEPPY